MLISLNGRADWTGTENLEDKIVSLANNFIAIDFLIDHSLREFEIKKG